MTELEKAAESKEQGWISVCGYTLKKGDVRSIFQAGAEWQQAEQSPWISVKERLPEPHTKVFFIVRYTDHASHYVGFWHNGEWETDDRIFTPNSKYSKTTHWMPIPQ